MIYIDNGHADIDNDRAGADNGHTDTDNGHADIDNGRAAAMTAMAKEIKWTPEDELRDTSINIFNNPDSNTGLALKIISLDRGVLREILEGTSEIAPPASIASKVRSRSNSLVVTFPRLSTHQPFTGYQTSRLTFSIEFHHHFYTVYI